MSDMRDVKKYNLRFGNPEFTRNLWQECTLQRLIVIPVILALLVALIMMSTSGLKDANRMYAVLMWLGIFGFSMTTIGWGSRLANSALMQEFSEGTWDSQRMSGLTPAQMLWGKLLGGTVMAWYAGAILLVLVVWAGLQVTDMRVSWLFKGVAALVLMAVLLHATGMSSLLAIWRKRDRQWGKGMRGMTALPAVVFFIFLWFASGKVPWMMNYYGDAFTGLSFVWFGMGMNWTSLFLLGLACLTIWALIGLWQQVRTELQFRNQPWWWLGFLLFWMVFFAGFVNDSWVVNGVFTSPWHLYLIVSIFAVSMTVYLRLFYERKDAMSWLRFFNAFKRKEGAKLGGLFPAWATSYLLACVLGAVFVGWVLIAPVPGSLRYEYDDSLVEMVVSTVFWDTSRMLAMAVVSGLLFMLRDIALVLWLNLAVNNRRADGAAILYLIVLYVLMPWFASQLLGREGFFLFVPLIGMGYYLNPSHLLLLSPLVQAVVMWGLLWRRWRTRKGNMLD